jgi:DNA-binding response OmpR family regulator
MSTPPEYERFVHTLLSPLTAIQGAIGLIRRRVATSDDPNLPALLATIERGAERLRRTCELLLRESEVEGERVRIEVALAELATAGMASRGPEAAHASPATQDSGPSAMSDGSVASNLLLIVAGEASRAQAIRAELERRGRPVLYVASSAEGLDQARKLRPALVMIDPQVDGQSEAALHILAEDPDTKNVRVAILGEASRVSSPGGPLQGVIRGDRYSIVEAGMAAAAAADLLDGAMAPGGAVGTIKRHILVVDDEPDIAALIALQFSDEGFQTTTVHSGAEALRMVREQQFDLVLLDLLLPDLDGFTVLGGLRAQPETQLTPIILVSALDSAVEKVRGLQLGADDYITKPFSAAELSARVQAAMRRSEREGGANPSTRLPGNIAIERAISQRIAQGQQFAVCYGDLDNFKAYNDSYGFLKGDAVILRTAQLLLEAVRAHGNADDFVGHIGGDDFVVITTPDRAHLICDGAIAQFDETAPLFYDAPTRAAGYISGVDRQGRAMQFPLVGISFAVVSSAWRPFSHPGEVAQRAAETKKRAKQLSGSVYLVEE